MVKRLELEKNLSYSLCPLPPYKLVHPAVICTWFFKAFLRQNKRVLRFKNLLNLKRKYREPKRVKL